MRAFQKRILSLITVLVLLASFLCTATANSAIKSWRGVRGEALFPVEQCPVKVLREKLTLRIHAFPAPNASGDADVTAEYTLRNPLEEEIRVRLMFPVGQAYDYINADGRYSVTVNGEKTSVIRRFSYPKYSDFHTQEEMSKLQDGFFTDAFWRPELHVTEYGFTIADAPEGAAVKLTYRGEYPALLFAPDGQEIYASAVPEASALQFYAVGDFRVAVFGGEAQSFDCVLIDGDTDAPLQDVRWEQTERGTDTMRAFLKAYAPKDSPISETDRYNAAVQWLRQFSQDSPQGRLLSADPDLFFEDHSFMEWYEYSLAFAPGETLVNTVTAPFSPDVDGRYEPAKYDYTYLLSPAAGWADFGGLDVEIQTPYFLLDSSIPGFTKTDSGWRLHTDGLPEKELKLTLSETEKPKRAPDDLLRELLLWLMLALGLMFCGACIIIGIRLIRKVIRAILLKRNGGKQ